MLRPRMPPLLDINPLDMMSKYTHKFGSREPWWPFKIEGAIFAGDDIPDKVIANGISSETLAQLSGVHDITERLGHFFLRSAGFSFRALPPDVPPAVDQEGWHLLVCESHRA